MQQRSSQLDEKWISYIVIIFSYTLAVVNDWLSALIFLILLLQFAGLVSKGCMYLMVQLVLIVDIILKSPYVALNAKQFMLDTTCIQLIFEGKVKPILFAYLCTHAYNLYVCFHTFINRHTIVHIKTWGPLMTQVMVYTQPLLMYTMSLISNYYPFRISWAVLACLQVFDIFPHFNHLVCCILITCFFFVPQIQPQYVIPIKNQVVNKQTNYIVVVIFVLILILLNVYSNPHPDYKQDIRKSLATTRRALRRQMQEEQSKLKRKSIIVLALAIFLCLITSSIGNIFIIFGIYLNIPQFKSKRFFFFTGFGIVISLILQPQQLSYFIYLYIVVLVVGQQITNTQTIQYQVHSYSFFLDFYKLYIMLSHVSFLNWLIGMLRNSLIVTLVLSIRIFCRYFNYVSVFLGTNDDYGLIQVKFINLHSISDLVLIIYLIFLCLYSPKKTKTYGISSITNILLQYPILQKIKSIFTIFRIFNWFSYVVFSIIILSRKPSLYITIHIFSLVLIIIADTLNSQQSNPTHTHTNTNTTSSPPIKKYKLLKTLWNINFYVTFVMIFTRYLYFLRQYESNSQVMDYLLGILTKYKLWIGLDQLQEETQGLALVRYFLYDWSLLVVSWVNVYVYSVKIYYQDRRQSVHQQIQRHSGNNLTTPLLTQTNQYQNQRQRSIITHNNNANQQSNIQPIQTQQQKYQSIHYFYNRYIKPIDLSTYFAQHQYKLVQKILRDCLIDIGFMFIVLAFYLQKQSIDYLFYLPHFVISAYTYYYRFTHGNTLHFTQKILSLWNTYSFVILFISYLYITFLQIYNKDIPSAIVKIYITYILCIIMCLLYKSCCCIPIREQPQSKQYHSVIYLCFPFTVKSQKLWIEILSIFSQFWMTFTMALFFTNIFSPKLISTIVHPLVVVYLLLFKIGKHKSQTWMYIVCIVSIVDIWNYDFFAFFTIVAVVVFYAVKNGQKLAEQEAQGSYRDLISDQASVIAEYPQLQQDQPDPDCEQKNWSYYMAYCTIIWMLPQLISLLWMFGVVWLSPSIIATLLILFSYGNLIFQLLYQKQTKISQPLLIVTLGITVLFFLYQLFQYLIRLIVPDLQPYNHSEMGLFLIFDSCFFYLILKKRAAWYAKRGNDARLYWQQKSQLVGQLGSQLHNEKKLITLQKYYSSKQRLTQKVNNISTHLKQNAKKTYFQSLDSIFKTKQLQQTSYQLYTNMLIFLDMQLLKKCFLMINQYISALKSENVVEKAKLTRQEIYRTYQRSFNQAFGRLKSQQIQSQINRQNQLNDIQLMQQTSRTSTINLQKINQINQRYKRCFQIITKSTQKFNLIIRLIIQNLQIISMMIVIGWNLFGGVYTIPTNILIFGWAIVLQNKTTISFWIIVMTYTCIILILKQIIIYLPNIFILNFIFYYHGDDYLYEYFLVLISVIQITVIKLGGTRYTTYSERQSIYDAFYRAALNKAANNSDLDKEEDFMDIYKNLAQPQKHSFWYRVFSKSRFKPGKDFYPLMSTIQLIILLYIFFFYDMMQFQSRKNRKSIGQLLTVSQFSSHMVIALFLQIMIMILDRFIISLNLVDQENQALQNFFLSFTFSITEVKQVPPKKLDKVGIFDFLLVLKYLFHLTLLFGINFFVYFYIPSAGLTKSLIPACTQSQCDKSYTYLSIFLILYFAYFLVSGLQIKHGFNRNKCKNVLMQKYHWINYYTYKIFTAIPFAWEFKKICDWTVTSTALPLFHWMKFQDINARLYQSKCQAEMIKIKPLGTPWNKYYLGPCGFMMILLLVFSPFIIYSPVNPFAVKDAVIGARTDIYLKMDDRYDYKFFSTSHATVVQNTQMSLQLKLTNQNSFLIKMSKFPDQNFLISEPVVQKLYKQIQQNIITKKHKFTFVLYLTVFQQEGGESQIQWTKKQLSTNDLQNLCNLLKLKINQITIDKFYSPFPGQITLQSITISSPNGGQYFEVQLKRSNQNGKQLYFYYLTSNKFKVSVGILTFYLTYILVISRLLRFYLTGTVRNIIYEGCYLESILVLCQAVREARIVQNFLQQQSFYFELMDIMRHPKALKQITGDFLTFRKKYI